MKLRNYRESESVRTKFYYERTTDGTEFPVVSVCLKHDTASGEVSRGIAICATGLESEHRRSKRTGRNIAETRARWAMLNNAQNLRIKNIERFDPVAQQCIAWYEWNWYCDNRPMLSAKELNLLGLQLKEKKDTIETTLQPLPSKIHVVDSRNIFMRFFDWVGGKLS